MAEQPPQPSDRQLAQMRREQAERERRQTEQQMASGAAQQAIADQDFAAPGYWDIISGLDFEREQLDDDYIEDFLKPIGSKFNVLGNIPYGKWESLCWRIESELFVRRNELQDNDRLDDIDVATMYDEVKPKHTDERESRLKLSERALKMQLSLSVNAQGLRSGTEIHAVARTETGAPEEEDKGRLARAREYLSG